MKDFVGWFTGGKHYDYKTLFHCLDNDIVTLSLVVILCIGVFSGYMCIAYRWSKAALDAPESEAKAALTQMDISALWCLRLPLGYSRYDLARLALLHVFPYRA